MIYRQAFAACHDGNRTIESVAKPGYRPGIPQTGGDSRTDRGCSQARRCGLGDESTSRVPDGIDAKELGDKGIRPVDGCPPGSPVAR